MNIKGKRLLGLIIAFGTILCICLVFLVLSTKKWLPQPIESRLSPKPTDSKLYDSFNIPTTQIQYPNGWPQDLHYPQQLELVYARGSTEAGWEAALTFHGTAKEASDILENFFTNNGWTITDRTIQDENNFGLFIGRNNKEGVIIIGSNPATKTVKMTITVDE